MPSQLVVTASLLQFAPSGEASGIGLSHRRVNYLGVNLLFVAVVWPMGATRAGGFTLICNYSDCIYLLQDNFVDSFR
jgi:hypothetical protein